MGSPVPDNRMMDDPLQPHPYVTDNMAFGPLESNSASSVLTPVRKGHWISAR